MDPTDIGLFRLAERRLSWVDQRQALLAQNVANANTPNYHARDLPPFAATLAGAEAGGLDRTNPAHLAGTTPLPSAHRERGTGKSPDGNTVTLEKELAKVADTSSTQELVSNLYHKYQGLFRTVLGRNG